MVVEGGTKKIGTSQDLTDLRKVRYVTIQLLLSTPLKI